MWLHYMLVLHIALLLPASIVGVRHVVKEEGTVVLDEKGTVVLAGEQEQTSNMSQNTSQPKSHLEHVGKMIVWKQAHRYEEIPMKTKCQLCLQDSNGDRKFCPGGGVVREGASAECFSCGGNCFSTTSRCKKKWRTSLKECNDVIKTKFPEGWSGKRRKDFMRNCNLIAGSGSGSLDRKTALALKCNYVDGTRLGRFFGDRLNRGGHLFKLNTHQEIVLDSSTGLVCPTSDTEPSLAGACKKTQFQLWPQSDAPMAWVNAMVTGQISCAGFFLTDRANRYLYAVHCNTGAIPRLPSEIIDAMGWEVGVEDLVATYVVGGQSARDGVPDDGSMDEIQRLMDDGIPAENIYIGMHKGKGVDNSQVTLLRQDGTAQWSAFWGAF